MMKRTVQYLSILALAIGCLSVPRAVEAYTVARYDMMDYYDLIRPDLTPGEPLDKGFAISGYSIVNVPPPATPIYTIDDDIFVAWNITLEVRNDSGPNGMFTFTQDNSNWEKHNSGSVAGAPFLKIDQNFVSLIDNQQFSYPDFGANTLTLKSASLDQQIIWYRPYGGNWLFTAGTVTPSVPHGSYLGGGGDVEIARFNSMVPEPSSFVLVGSGVVGLLGFRRRQRRAAK